MPSLAAVTNPAPAPCTNEPEPRSAAQAEASRLNGARSRGPVTEAGRRRSAQNGRRHGLRSKTTVLAAEDARELAAIRSDLRCRWPVETPVERHWLERLASCHLRQAKLEEIEFLAMDALLFDTDEPEARRLPSLATLLRYRRQVGRDMAEAGANLQTLIEARLHGAGGTDESDGWEEDEGVGEGRVADDVDGWDDDTDPCADESAPKAAPMSLPGIGLPDPRTDPVGWRGARHREILARFAAGERG